MDIERLFRHMSEGRPRDELVVNSRGNLRISAAMRVCAADDEEYDYALTAIPGAALRPIYEKYGPPCWRRTYVPS